MTPTALAARALGVAPEAITHVEPVKHGLTNESWLVRTSDQAAVVRVSAHETESLRIDRWSEAAVLECVASAGLAPEVLLNDWQQGHLVTRYAGEHWTFDEAQIDASIRRLAVRLQELHQLHVPRDVRRVDLSETVEGYLATLDRQGKSSILTTPAWRERARQATSELRADATLCLCHNDVHHLNIVGGQRAPGPLLIDWEYAGLGDPAFDLASVCVYHRYDAPRRGVLLDEYAAHGPPVLPERLERACWVFEYVRDLWMAVRESTDVSR